MRAGGRTSTSTSTERSMVGSADTSSSRCFLPAVRFPPLVASQTNGGTTWFLQLFIFQKILSKMKSSLAVPAAALAAAACAAGPAAAFAPQVRSRSATALQFGIPKWMDPTANQPDEGRGENPDSEKKIGLSGLAQLITAGMGSPFLGDFEGVDKETGKMMFSLEANNLVDEDGQSKQTSMPYFESGWVDPQDMEKERQKKEKGGGGFKFW